MKKIRVVLKDFSMIFEGDDLEAIDGKISQSGSRLHDKLIIVRNGKSDLGRHTIAVFREWIYWREIEEEDEHTPDDESLASWKADKKQIMSIADSLKKASISESLRKVHEKDKKKIVEKGSRKYEKPKEEPKTPEWKPDKDITMVVRKGEDYKPRHRKGQCTCVFHHIDYPCAEGCPKCSK